MATQAEVNAYNAKLAALKQRTPTPQEEAYARIEMRKIDEEAAGEK